MKRVDDQTLLEVYAMNKSVWLTGKEVGLCGQSVHERLVKLGAIDKTEQWAPDEIMFLLGWYSSKGANEPMNIDDLVCELNRVFGKRRLKSNVCRKAKELGLGTSRTRKKTVETKIHMSNRASSKKGIHSGAAKSGTREDIGLFVRSSWEANYARYLNLLIDKGKISGWEYEPQRFPFLGRTIGPFVYIPDFKVTFEDGSHEWHEVKGYMDSSSRNKIKLFKKHYPLEKLVVIGHDEYTSISQWASLIPNWEYPQPRNK